MKQVCLVIGLLLFTCNLNSHAQEFRTAVSAEFDVLPQVEGSAEVELRTVFDPMEYFNRTYQFALEWQAGDRWSIGGAYTLSFITRNKEYTDGEGDENADRQKFVADLGYQTKRFDSDLRLTNRFRYQYTTEDNDEIKQYLRNRLKLDYKVSSYMNPYIAVEPYYRFSSKNVKLIRLYLGNEMPLFGHKLELYYIAELHLKYRHNTAQYIIGAKFELDFKK